MRRIPISQAKPGMILGRSAARSDGMTILPESAELTAGHLERLACMGVEYLTIKGDDALGCTEGRLNLFRRRLERLPHLFRSHASDSWMEKVRTHLETFLNQRVEDCSNQAPAPSPDTGGQESA